MYANGYVGTAQDSARIRWAERGRGAGQSCMAPERGRGGHARPVPMLCQHLSCPPPGMAPL
jgi:hypothetical protein